MTNTMTVETKKHKAVKLGFDEICTECGKKINQGEYAIPQYYCDEFHARLVAYKHIEEK
jgi:hypothetical protein